VTAAVLLALAAAGAASAAAPAPEALLDRMLAEPDAAYEGRVVVTQWYGKGSRSEEIVVRHRPPLLRREFLNPDGSVARISVSDGEAERILDPRTGRQVSGDAVGAYLRALPPERERELLRANYELSSATGEAVASRPVWVLVFAPREEGKPSLSFSLDRETGVVLGLRRNTPGRRRLASSARFLRFEPNTSSDPALFALPDSSAAVAAPGLSPDFMTRDDLNKAGGALFPESLPGGFAFESGDGLTVKGHVVRHARYTDGVTAVSLFHADRPFRAPAGGGAIAETAALGGSALSLTSAGRILQWKGSGGSFLLMGDVSRTLLERLAKSLGAPSLAASPKPAAR
jgi:hypothetical protein